MYDYASVKVTLVRLSHVEVDSWCSIRGYDVVVTRIMSGKNKMPIEVVSQIPLLLYIVYVRMLRNKPAPGVCRMLAQYDDRY